MASVAAFLVYVSYFHGPRERDNPSFLYGEKIMHRDVYGSLTGGSVGAACRAAIDKATDAPKNLDVAEAISGCKYEEYTLDN
jgi:hypothetical protein